MASSPFQIRSDQSLSHVRLFVTPWIAAHQASLSITNSQSSLRLTSIESVMPSSPLILCRPLLLLPSIFPASGSFPMSPLFASGGQSIGTSTSASVLPMNVQGWFPLGWTGLISLRSKRLSRVFSSTTVWKQCRVCRSKTTDADWLTTFLLVELHSVFSVNIPCFYLVPIIVGIWNQIYVKCYWWPLTGQIQSVFLRS